MTGGWYIRRNVKPQTVEIVHSPFPLFKESSVSSISLLFFPTAFRSGERKGEEVGWGLPGSLEYALSQSNPDWKDVPSGAALSQMG